MKHLNREDLLLAIKAIDKYRHHYLSANDKHRQTIAAGLIDWLSSLSPLDKIEKDSEV
jgi:hypothetical protein|tara:strand:- start:218 stop:391 length:174 start_codon:yes stop_codon:yes gene_type:complete